MCEPTTLLAIGSMAVTAASTVVQYNGARSAGNAQYDATLDNLHARDATLQWQQEQANQSASQEMSQRALDTLRARGHLAAVFSDSGVGGNSQARAFNAENYADSTDMATLEASRSSRIVQGQIQRNDASRTAIQDINAIKMPSLIGAGLQIVSGGLNAYSGYQNAQRNIPQNKAGS